MVVASSVSPRRYDPLALNKSSGTPGAHDGRWCKFEVACADPALNGLGLSFRQDQLAPAPLEFGVHDAVADLDGKPGPIDLGNETCGKVKVRQPRLILKRKGTRNDRKYQSNRTRKRFFFMMRP